MLCSISGLRSHWSRAYIIIALSSPLSSLLPLTLCSSERVCGEGRGRGGVPIYNGILLSHKKE